MLTPLLLPQVTSIIIGTGTRDAEKPALEDAGDSIDLAVLTSAVAPEFSDGYTLHLDVLFCLVAEHINPRPENLGIPWRWQIHP